MWCSKSDLDPYSCDVNEVVNYLAELFNTNNLLYRSLGVIRPAISAYHNPIEGVPIGQHRLVENFIGGVDKLRPPKPKYNYIWDVKIVTDYLENLGPQNELCWQILNRRLAAILALTNFKRANDLHRLDVRLCTISEDAISFGLVDRPKQCRKKGVSPEPIVFEYKWTHHFAWLRL